MSDLTVGLVLKADASGLKGEVKVSREELERLSKAARDTGAAGTRAGAGLDRTASGARSAAAGINRIDARPIREVQSASVAAASAIGRIGGLVAGAFAVREVTQFAAGAVRVEAAYEGIQARLEFLTGSQARAAEEARLAADAADRLATSEQAVLDIRSRLLPLERSGAISRANSLAVTEGLIDATKALGADTGQLGNVMYGLSQALSSAVVRAEEYNQVVEPLPGLAQELDRAIADMTDGAVTNFRRLVNEGEATRELFAEALVRALEAFEGAGTRSADTINGKLQTLQNEWDRFRRAIVDSALVQNGVEIAIRFVQAGNAAASFFGDRSVDVANLDAEMARRQEQLERTLSALEARGRDPETSPAVQQLRTIIARLDLEIESLTGRRAAEAQAAQDRAAAAAAESAAADRVRLDRVAAARALALDADRTGKRASELRDQIEALNSAVGEGLITAAEAAPGLADLAEQLDKLLNPPSSGGGGTTRDAVAGRIGALRGEIATLQALAGAATLEGEARRNREIAILSEAAALKSGAKAGSAQAETLATLEARVLRLRDAEEARAEALRQSARAEADAERERERLDRQIATRAARALKASEDAKKAAEKRVAALLAEAAAAESVLAAWRSGGIAGGEAEAARLEAESTARAAAEGGGDYSAALAAAERLAAAEAAIAESRDRAAKAEREATDTARDHARAVERIAAGVDGLGSVYERAMARAARWREEALEGLDPAKAGYADFVAEAERVYEAMVQSTRDGLAGSLIDELQRLKPTLAQAVSDIDVWREETLAALDAVGIATAGHVATVEALYGERLAAALEEDLARRKDWAAGIERGLKDINEQTGDWASQSERLVKSWSSSAEDAFTSLASTGKFEMKSLVDTVLADMARLVYRQTVGKATNSLIESALGGLGSLFGGLFSAEVKHAGGIAGSGGPSRAVAADVFAGAARYHSGGIAGLRPGEVPIIAERGEHIVTARDAGATSAMIHALAANATRPVMVEGGGAPQVIINNYTGAQVQQRQTPGGGIEIDILAEQVGAIVAGQIGTGNSPINQSMESTYRLPRNFSGGRR